VVNPATPPPRLELRRPGRQRIGDAIHRLRTGMTLLKVSVTPGQSPASTGITAIADLTSIGGSATQALFDDGTNGDVTMATTPSRSTPSSTGPRAPG